MPNSLFNNVMFGTALFNGSVAEHCVTPADVIGETLHMLDEADADNSVRWSRPEILTYLNDGLNELNLISGEYQETFSVAWSQTGNVIDLPESAIAPLEVSFGNKIIQRTTIESLDAEVQWDSSSQVGGSPKRWAPLGLTKIVVWPRASTSGQSLSVTVLQIQLNADDVTCIDLPFSYVDAPKDYAFYRARFKEGGAEFVQSINDYRRFMEKASDLMDLNIFQRWPAWLVAPVGKAGEETK